MRRLLLSFALLVCFAAPSQAAQGMNLRWDACMADGGVLNKDFACDTDTGSEQLYVSFELDSTVGSVSGIELSMLVRTPSGLPPAWWQSYFGSACRRTAISASAIPLLASSGCEDPWQGMAGGGLSSYSQYFGYFDNNQYRLLATFAVAPSNVFTLDPGVEYFAMRIAIAHTKTVGTGSCQGCLQPACMGIESLKITRTIGNSTVTIATETQQQSSVASWQGSPVISDYYHYRHPLYASQDRDLRVLACQATSRSQNRTWGSIKSLYR